MSESRPETTEITWELVRKRNFVERLKHEKGGLDVLRDLPAMVATGYEAVPEEDFVRLQWYGLYHDKPKLGYFMMRVKIPGGILTPAELRTIGEHLPALRPRPRRADHAAEHPAPLAASSGHLPEVLRVLAAGGLSTTGACGDNVRNITGCPVAGIDRDELFEVRGPARGSRRISSSATASTPTCRASTRSRSRPARTSATRRRSTASP